MENSNIGLESGGIKRNIKDSVFGDLFGNPKYLLQLYQVLHPEDNTVTEKDFKDVTITNVLTDQMYNDLGFRVRDSFLILAEAQSTWTANILPRMLMYLGETWNRYFTETNADLYGGRKVKIPKPELYVIFTGDSDKIPSEICFRDEFFNGQTIDVDIRAKVLAGGSDDIISQYVTFSKVATDMTKKYGKTPEAIKETLRICRDRNILVEYLKERGTEVMSIMEALFDQEEVTRRYMLRVEKEAIERGMEKGIEKGIMDMLTRGRTPEEVSEFCGYPIEMVKKVQDEMLVSS